MPTITGDVASINPSCTHDVARDTVNEPQRHTLTRDCINDTYRHTTQHNEIMFVQISKSELVLLKKDAQVGREIKKDMNKKQFTKSPLARYLIGIAMMHAPKLGLAAAANLIPLFVSSFLVDCELDSLLDSVASSSPSAATLKYIVIDEAIGTIMMKKREISGIPLTLLCDKG